MAVRRQYTALQIDQLRDHGRHAIGDGLYLEIDSAGKRETHHHRFAFITDEYCWLGEPGCAF
jgi:hypothetical protein